MPDRQSDLFPTETRSAEFSSDRVYRYTLQVVWDPRLPVCAFCGLNPSTADETRDDPTVRRCKNYAKFWGYGGMFMMNLFAFRSTDPKPMLKHPDPVGEMNDFWLAKVRSRVEIMVAAWGTMGTHRGRDKEVLKIISPADCLRITADGHPSHPLYLPKDLRPVLFTPRA